MAETLNNAIQKAIGAAMAPINVRWTALESRQLALGKNVLMAVGSLSGYRGEGCTTDGEPVFDDGTNNGRYL